VAIGRTRIPWSRLKEVTREGKTLKAPCRGSEQQGLAIIAVAHPAYVINGQNAQSI